MDKKSAEPLIHFPRDEGSHPEFIMEWWYGHFCITDSEGKEYGVMVAYFNIGLKILAISEFANGCLHQFISGSTLHSSEGRFDLRWGRDHWLRIDDKSFSYQLQAYGGGLGLHLALNSEKPPLLGCNNGRIEWTGGSAYYYSLTRLEAKGQIELSGRKIDVEGIGFTDHQWMNALGEGGWDWFVAQLDNNMEIVFWHIISLEGKLKSRDLTVMFADRSAYHTQDFTLEQVECWVSSQSGREYGVVWRLRDEARHLDLLIKARHSENEIRMLETLSVPTFHFWEGMTSIEGHLGGKRLSGIGYAEFVRLIENI